MLLWVECMHAFPIYRVTAELRLRLRLQAICSVFHSPLQFALREARAGLMSS
jgi:hypothetical protein